jgi:hypothetical protein
MKIPPPIIPREHGAWAVLFVPMLAMLLHERYMNYRFILQALSSLGLFLCYVPAQTILRHLMRSPQNPEKLRQAKIWAAIYGTAGVSAALPLLVSGYYLLVPLGAIGILAFAANYILTGKSSRTIPGDLVSVFGLSLSGLGAYYVLTGSIDSAGLILWIMQFFFFGSSVFYVHMKIQAAYTKSPLFSCKEKLKIGSTSLAFQTALTLFLVGIVVTWSFPVITALAFLPLTLQVFYGAWNLKSNVRFKNLGFLLLGQAVLFGLIVGFSFSH